MPVRIESRDSNRYLYTQFITALFTVTKRWKQSKGPSIDEWTNTMLFINTVEY